MVTLRGRLTPEVGALLVQALAAARETLYQRARVRNADADTVDVSAEPCMWLAPLPVDLKLRMLPVEGAEVVNVTGA